ncbi:MAG: hypothetical protein R2788_01545 [Saprospiraceae bacterium]
MNGKNTDETIFYYQNGQIKSYYYYNTNGEAIYNKKFSEDGEVILETGVPFYIFTTDSDWSRVKEGGLHFFYTILQNFLIQKIRVLIGEKTESEPFNVIYDKDIIKMKFLF